MEKVKRLFGALQSRYRVLAEKRYTTIAGTLVFFLVLSVVPFAFWVTLLFGKFLVGTESVLNLEVFAEIRDLLLFVQENARAASSGASFVLLLTSLYSASNFFYHLRASGEIIYNYPRKKGGLRVRLFALLLTLGAMATLALFLGIFVGVLCLFRLFLPALPAEIGGYCLLFALSFGVCVVLNLYLCPYRIRWRETVKGSLLTTLCWAVASFGFSVYLRLGNMSKLYGAVSAIIVFLLWSYVMMVCFVIGVIYNEHYVEKRHKKLYFSTEGRENGGLGEISQKRISR